MATFVGARIEAEEFFSIEFNGNVMSEAFNDISRAGEDGHLYTQTGRKGLIDVAVTYRDCNSYSEMQTNLDAYAAMVAFGQPVAIFVALPDGDYTMFNYFILSVRQVSWERAGVVSGVGVNDPPGNYWQVCEWHLQKQV